MGPNCCAGIFLFCSKFHFLGKAVPGDGFYDCLAPSRLPSGPSRSPCPAHGGGLLVGRCVDDGVHGVVDGRPAVSGGPCCAEAILVVSLLGGAAAPKCWHFGGLPGRRLPRPSPFSWTYRCSGSFFLVRCYFPAFSRSSVSAFLGCFLPVELCAVRGHCQTVALIRLSVQELVEIVRNSDFCAKPMGRTVFSVALALSWWPPVLLPRSSPA